MAIIVIENTLDSPQSVIISEDLDGEVLRRDLKPGENARISISNLNAISISAITGQGQTPEPVVPFFRSRFHG
ncbi:MAG TPA: hypothetical protein VGI79_00820 [Caulobacteraceae bacterium]|jgi:hypothetical protein